MKEIRSIVFFIGPLWVPPRAFGGFKELMGLLRCPLLKENKLSLLSRSQGTLLLWDHKGPRSPWGGPDSFTKKKSYLIYYTIFDFLRWLFQSWRWLFQNFEMIIWMIIPDAVFEDIKTMIIWQIGMIIWDDYIRKTTILAPCLDNYN